MHSFNAHTDSNIPNINPCICTPMPISAPEALDGIDEAVVPDGDVVPLDIDADVELPVLVVQFIKGQLAPVRL